MCTGQVAPCAAGPLFNMEQLLLLSPPCLSAVSSASWPITAELSLSLPSLSGYMMAVGSVKTGQESRRGKEAEQDS